MNFDRAPITLRHFLQIEPSKDYHNLYLIVTGRKVTQGINGPYLWYDAVITEKVPFDEHMMEINPNADNYFNFVRDGDHIIAFDEDGTLKKWEVTHAVNNIKTTFPKYNKEIVTGQCLHLKEICMYSADMAEKFLSMFNIPYPYDENANPEQYEELPDPIMRPITDDSGNTIGYKIILN